MSIADVPTPMSMSRVRLSRTWLWLRARELEGTFPGDLDTGCWAITCLRVNRGWGHVEFDDFPSQLGLRNWPPPLPSSLDESAKQRRISLYTRVWDAVDCKAAFRRHECVVDGELYPVPISADFRVTRLWHQANEGRLDFDQSGEHILGGHSLTIWPHDSELPDDYFRVQNSWGSAWGSNGWGSMSPSFFDKEMFESWSIDPGAKFPRQHGSGVQEFWQSTSMYHDRVIYVHDIVDVDTDTRLAWSIAVQRHGVIHVEELFVRPDARRQGHASKLFARLSELSDTVGHPLQFWIPFADVERAESLMRLVSTFGRWGYRLESSSRKSAAYCAVSGSPTATVSAVELPPKPAYAIAAELTPHVDWEHLSSKYGVSHDFVRIAEDIFAADDELLRRLA